ncbi:MAG: NAD(P)-dependent oxidoreductase [Acidimicrobiia bacterium]|nr:NAD(P)-dependent oxidoreductase [Acidimicrobiia bacterium]
MRILITGGTGYLGTAMTERVPAGIEAIRLGHARGSTRLDVTDAGDVDRVLTAVQPDAVVHLAAVSRLASASEQPDRAGDVNEVGSDTVARAAAARSIRLVALSSDVVFDGRSAPYNEDSPTNPINPYGRTKLAGEHAIRRHCPGALIVRTSVLVGRDRAARFPFSTYVLEEAAAGRPVQLFDNERRNFFPVTMAAAAVWDLALAGVAGTLHVAAAVSASRFEFGRRLLVAAGLDPALAVAAQGPPDRPGDLTLDTTRAAQVLGRPMPSMDAVIAETLRDGLT